MSNTCYFEMKIKGSKSAIERVVNCLKAHYDYKDGKPAHKHFFRVFNTQLVEKQKIDENTYFAYIIGDCAWSVFSCMCRGKDTYYNEFKERYPNTFNGTDLLEQSRNCTIEIFSEEGGIGFSEHYLFKNQQKLIDVCVDTETAGYDEKGEITTDIDWDEYDGEWLYLSSNRVNNTGDFNWAI